MRGFRSGLSAAAIAGALAACAYNPLYPDLRTPADRAREIASQCRRASETLDAHILSPEIIEQVDPFYSYVASGNDRVPRLRGARMRIRPEPAFSPEVLQRGIECHEARIASGTTTGRSDDPYWLPGSWLDIKAESMGDGFVVAVLVDDNEKAKRVLDRARQFVASRH